MNVYSQHIITNPDNNTQELYPFHYLEFYEANIHPYDEFTINERSERINQGCMAQDFFQSHKDGFQKIIPLILNDSKLSKLQNELESEGKQVCMFNLFILAMFLVMRGKSRYVFLLKPRIQETLSALNNVTQITFTNADGTTTESTNSTLIKEVMKTLEAQKTSDSKSYKIEKIVSWAQLSNKSVLQSYFVHDLTIFLNRYFPMKRKKDAQVSTKEVELILYLMKLVDLSKEELTNKRYWQLMATYEKISHHTTDMGQFRINGTDRLIPLIFIPYEAWSKGKIDWTEENIPRLNCEEGDTIQF
ncbi:hypothetical protein [Mediterranea massiliensis]|uniref:hypothetical protein n=1 Tax=Mediterranea massiliensis TaxID=1841865 RepID=UPI00266C7F0C|nr:hypothetical protein [Mediterranea massiliensis]